MRHVHHDEIAATVRGWYTSSFPEMGYHIEQARFGWYGWNAAVPSVGRVTVSDVSAGSVPDVLADARAYFPAALITLYVADRRQDKELAAALTNAGCVRRNGEIYLAHLAAPSPPRSLEGLGITMCAEPLLKEYAVTKCKGFADSEDEPSAEDIAEEVGLRKAELAGSGHFAIARLYGEACGTVGWYTDGDALIFDLATRMPYRRRGVATALLFWVLEREYAGGSRSVIINADEEGRPAQLYRRLGFTDEVFWRRPYGVPPAGG